MPRQESCCPSFQLSRNGFIDHVHLDLGTRTTSRFTQAASEFRSTLRKVCHICFQHMAHFPQRCSAGEPENAPSVVFLEDRNALIPWNVTLSRIDDFEAEEVLLSFFVERLTRGCLDCDSSSTQNEFLSYDDSHIMRLVCGRVDHSRTRTTSRFTPAASEFLISKYAISFCHTWHIFRDPATRQA